MKVTLSNEISYNQVQLALAVLLRLSRLTPLPLLIYICLIYLPHGVVAQEKVARLISESQIPGCTGSLLSSSASGYLLEVLVGISIASSLILLVQYRRRKATKSATRPILAMVAFISTSLALVAALWPSSGLSAACGPVTSGVATSLASTATTSWRPAFTVPPEADIGENILPNVQDPQAVNVQDVCPGYTASGVTTTANGFTANLDIAGPACNVYGNDIANLTLSVEYQATDRVNVRIEPRYIGRENETWFILPESIIPRPGAAASGAGAANSDLEITWSNEPTFSFTVTRKPTSDVLFTTNGTVLVYADQFIEFASPLPEDYNLYGLGEVIHGFRLGNNLTRELQVL